MSVPSVFISSVVSGFEDVRTAAATAIARMRMHPIRSEERAAAAASPRRAFLDEIAESDIFLLLLGPRYGEEGPGGTSPTEDEFREAARLHKPILVLVAEGDLDARQGRFLEEIKGGWGEGVLYGHFAGAADVGTAVAAALARHQTQIVEDAPGASSRALELAGGDARGGSGGGVAGRVVFVPLRRTTLLDALALEDLRLGEDLAAALRSSGVVSQAVGIDAHVGGSGIALVGTSPEDWVTPEAHVAPDGAISVLGPVLARTSPTALSYIDPDRVQALIRGAGAAAQAIYARIDRRDEVGQLALAASISGASYTAYGAPSGNLTSIGMGIPALVVAPEPPEIAPRAGLAEELLARRVEAALRRIFADAGSLQR
jgi:Domain of unknown function (DUF4062)